MWGKKNDGGHSKSAKLFAPVTEDKALLKRSEEVFNS